MHLVCTLLEKSIMCKWPRPFWGTDCQRAPKSLCSAQVALFAVPALRSQSSKVLAGSAFCEMPSQYPRSAFQGLCGCQGGQQQLTTQTLCVHLLGIEKHRHTKKHLETHQLGSHPKNSLYVGVLPLENKGERRPHT